ncbi:hypothetical protein PSPO_b0889 [Pseudoalteromonas spongiae UST010723-006]|nr:hypothetical protein PSPO_b0889 [Pseudoalteromonas spongiae UST010723-006]
MINDAFKGVYCRDFAEIHNHKNEFYISKQLLCAIYALVVIWQYAINTS